MEKISNVKIADKILGNITEIHSMPLVFLEALESIKDPKVNAMKLSNIISKDIALTTKLLNLVNSAYYGFPKQITKVENAIALLGLKTVRNIIMGMALKPMMLSQRGKDLWMHSMRCAFATQFLSESYDNINPEEAFIVGLLHDIGRVLFQMYDPKAFDEVNRLVKLGAYKLDAEEQVFGVNHTVMGEAFAKDKNLPSMITSSIKQHHTPHEVVSSEITSIVYVAERLTQDPVQYPILDPDIMDMLDMHIENPMELREEIFEKSELIISTLSR